MANDGADVRKWHADTARGAPQTVVRWLEADPPLHPDVRLGISDTGDWVVASADGVVRFREQVDFPGLLPLLELSLSEFQSRLHGAFSRMTFIEVNRPKFPIEQLVIYGLRAWGKHWPALALTWASSLPQTEELAKTLTELVVHGPTQQIRHGAKHVVFRDGGGFSS